VDFQQKYIYKTLAAQAIGSSGTDQSRVFYIDKGKDYGLQPIWPSSARTHRWQGARGLSRSAQVLAINDQSSGAGVILETTRIRGILRGNAAGRHRLSASEGRSHPARRESAHRRGRPDLPARAAVGVVEKVVTDPERDSFIDVIVKPAAHLDRLDECW